jgi:hypothetical protein
MIGLAAVERFQPGELRPARLDGIGQLQQPFGTLARGGGPGRESAWAAATAACTCSSEASLILTISSPLAGLRMASASPSRPRIHH